MVLAAVGQICSTASLSHNLAQCQTLARKAAAAGAKALFLPEASDYIASGPAQSLSLVQPATSSPFVQGLCLSAKEHGLHINVGIHEPTDPPSSRLCNNLVWISSQGKIAHRYQKLHVFDIDLTSTGGPRMKESESTEPGSRIEPPYDLTTLGLEKIGSLICFDLRFPEPALVLRRLGAQILLYPSAFTVPTGRLHWETLLRARAIENQSWVIASAQCGRHNEKRVSYGDTMVIDPNGKIVDRLERVENLEDEIDGQRDPCLLLVDLDFDGVDGVRRGIPLLRRSDVYAAV